MVAIPCCPRPTRNASQRVKRTWNTADALCSAARICRESRLKAVCVPQCGALHDGRGQQGSPDGKQLNVLRGQPRNVPGCTRGLSHRASPDSNKKRALAPSLVYRESPSKPGPR